MADINKKVEIDDSNSIVAQDNEDEGSDDNTTTASSSAAANAKKKKKKHRKRAAIVDEQGKTPESQEKLEEIRRRIAELAIEEERARKPSEVVNLVDDARMPKWAKPSDTDIARIENTQHKFWDNEPVPKLGELGANKNESMRHGVVADVPTTGYPLPPQLEWCTCDIGNADEMDEIYNLLKLHYVEDDDCLFRFLYGIDFLKWALTPPGWHPEWHVGIRALPKDGQKGKLLAFITGIPTAIRVYDKVISVAEINFLCVHKKLRSKRLAPLLIKEVTRRVHLKDVWHAVYTAGSVLPRPVASCTYYHRSINPRKLVDIKFSFLPNGMTMDRLIKRMYLPENTKSKTRPMTKLDVPAVHRLLTTALSNRKLAINWTQDEVGHWLIPRAGVVSTFVIEDESHNVTDFFSFYHLPSSVIGNQKYDSLHAVYLFYYAANTVSVEDVLHDMLILARNEGADVVNALDIMGHQPVFEFAVGDGHLNYYIYNWVCPQMLPESVGLVLL